MKRLSGLAVLAILTLAALPAARAQTAPKTEAALMCLIGQAPVGCDESLRGSLKSCYFTLDPGTCYPFIRTRVAFIRVQRCNSPDGSLGDACELGQLDSVTYLGTQKNGYDVYDVKYRNNEETYLLAAEPNGEFHFHRFGGPPMRVMPPSMVAITSPSEQVLFRQG